MKSQILRIINGIEEDLSELRKLVEDYEGASTDGSGGKQREPVRIGPFEALGDPETGVEFPWPGGQTDRYETLQHYVQPSTGQRYALGYAEPFEFYGRLRPYVVVHEVSRAGGLNAVAVFVGADDYEESHEFLCVIKGKGPGGRQMFRPGDQLPADYEEARTAPFTTRVTGPYSRDGLALVVPRDKPVHMLKHAAVQRRRRS